MKMEINTQKKLIRKDIKRVYLSFIEMVRSIERVAI